MNNTSKLIKIGYIDYKMKFNCAYATVKVGKSTDIKAKKVGLGRLIDL